MRHAKIATYVVSLENIEKAHVFAGFLKPAKT